MSMTRADRVRGGLFGLLVGDAMGVPYEFKVADECVVPPRAGFIPSHRVPAGTWSDDGAQALTLLASLLSKGRFDIDDFASRLLDWVIGGKMAVDHDVFDVGIQTRVALRALARGVDPRTSGPSRERDNGNGSLMRVLPLALWHTGSDAELVRDAMDSSLPTHGHMRSQLCCAIYCMWARCELDADHDDTWRIAVARTTDVLRRRTECADELALIVARDAMGTGSSYVLDCLCSARMVVGESFESTIVRAIGLGEDTDTTAAVAGGIAGIRFGFDSIPAAWLGDLRSRDLPEYLLGLLGQARV